MVSKASVKFIHISPRKVRYVINLIRRKDVFQAIGILNSSPRRAGGIVKKLLDAAVDAAQKNSQVFAKDLYISRVIADGGPVMKRFRPMSMGRAGAIRKRTSHIHLELDLKKGVVRAPEKSAAKIQTKKAPLIRHKTSADPSFGGKAVAKKLVGAR